MAAKLCFRRDSEGDDILRGWFKPESLCTRLLKVEGDVHRSPFDFVSRLSDLAKVDDIIIGVDTVLLERDLKREGGVFESLLEWFLLLLEPSDFVGKFTSGDTGFAFEQGGNGTGTGWLLKMTVAVSQAAFLLQAPPPRAIIGMFCEVLLWCCCNCR